MLEPKCVSFECGAVLIAAHHHLLFASVNTCHLVLQLNAGDCRDWQKQQAKRWDTKAKMGCFLIVVH